MDMQDRQVTTAVTRIKEACEQTQEDVRTYLDGMPDGVIDDICSMIVQGFNQITNP